jgi:uncharacterized protein YbjT (DUF2867 family)
MKIGIIGGTGFVGNYLLDRLAADGHSMRVLTRPGSEDKLPPLVGVEAVAGDVADESALRECLSGCDAAVYLIGILREVPSRGITFDALQRRGAERTIAVAEEQGVKRFLLMSANGVDAAKTPYQTTKLAAEEALMSSGLDWTIFRPSVIFGPPQGRMEFCTQLKQELIDSPMPAPLFYAGVLPKDPGGFLLAPVHAEDVAAAFATALTSPEAVGKNLRVVRPGGGELEADPHHHRPGLGQEEADAAGAGAGGRLGGVRARPLRVVPGDPRSAHHAAQRQHLR